MGKLHAAALVTLSLIACDSGGADGGTAAESGSSTGSGSSTTGAASSGDLTSTTAASSSSTVTSTAATDETTRGDVSSSTTSSDTSSTSTGGLDLEGDPPLPASYQAADEADFERLPDDDAFTDFAVEGNRLQILPLRDENFPPDLDYCTVGSDAELNDLQQWARAQLQADLQTWYYDVTLTVVAEEDGESAFGLAIDGELFAMASAPSTKSTRGVGDMDDTTVTWEMVPIEAASVVEIWARAHSNFALEEPAGCRQWSPTYAWARGRWRQLDLVATPGVQ